MKRPPMDPALYQLVMERDQARCVRCGDTAYLHVHHRVLRSRGGIDHPDNLVVLCGWPKPGACHTAVHDRNEHPYVIPGRFLYGVYQGPDESFARLFLEEAS